MLEKIEIENLQGHLSTTLELHKGVNAIAGDSTAGKTSICRAVELIAKNRPRGFAYRTWDYLKPKGPTKVAVIIDGVTAKRIKSKSINKYELSTEEEPFNVVNMDVPEKIKQFLNFDDITIQSQHDKYFLLQDTPGKVAQKLNRVAGFEIIDYTSKSVKSDISNNNIDIKYIQADIDELESKIAEYDHLEEVKLKLTAINKLVKTYQEEASLHNTIKNTIQEMESIREEIESINGWLQIEEDIKPILQVINEYRQFKQQLDNLNTIIANIEFYKKSIRKSDNKIQFERNIADILNLIDTRNDIAQLHNKITNIVQSVAINKDKIKDARNNIKEYEVTLETLIKKYEICPMCGGKLTDDSLRHIKELI